VAHSHDHSQPHTHPHTHDHKEHHFRSSDVVRDVVIGMADGLTVPFALAAGLSGVHTATTHIVILGGLAEIAAGSIAMGLGGYLAANGDAVHYASERQREEREIIDRTHDEEEEIYEIFENYGVTREESHSVLLGLKRNPTAWVDFMMRFELGLEEPMANRATWSALTIGFAYIVGGFVPLAPYMITGSIAEGLRYSIIITLIALFIFGGIKGRATGVSVLRSAFQTVFVGGLAAGAAFALARLLSNHS
jgi:vacuolar iron transporter family protein